MFENTPKDLAQTLTEMQRVAYHRSNANQIQAREKMREYVEQDRRFKGYDADRLVNRVMECRSNGRVLDLDDPWLHGGEKRPLSR